MLKNIPAIATLFLTLLSFLSAKPVHDQTVCIQNIAVIDAQNGLRENMTVVLKGNKILKVVKYSAANSEKADITVDGKGKYMIPGLWDAHMHFAYIEELAPSMFRLFLSYGITSIRDTGGEIEFVKKWKDKALADPTAAPRVMIAGPLIDGLPNVYDGQGIPELSVGMATVEDAVHMVDQLVEKGVDFIKAYEMLSPEQFVAVTKRAKEKGLKVSCHVPLSMDAIAASDAGINSMEHLRNLEMSCAANPDELLSQRRKLLAAGKNEKGGRLRGSIHQAQREKAIDNFNEKQAQKVLSVLAKNNTWQVPTLVLSTASSQRPFARRDWQESYRFLPESIEQKWLKGVTDFLSKDIAPAARKYADWAFDMVKRIHQAKIPLMAGTDCPIYYLTPGLSLHEELVLLVKSGLTPLEAIEAATLNPARFFNLENELGLIEDGMQADLVILDANPLENISNTLLIHAVVRQGRVYNRIELDKMRDRPAKQ